MSDIKIDHCIRMETHLGIKFGPEIEMVLTAEYDGSEFVPTELECDGVVLKVKDLKNSIGGDLRRIWDRAEYDLLFDDDLRSAAWRKHEEEQYEAA